ncbi:Rap1 Myb domain containing protein [Acanthamoeba castellanii str. Neff]|uniref:Rap1 Myb domain containing protein n=1 Tax=Acanthamoeba castellanii (strain ATCC 30010 / Neff) TaxID=1257118 RepID=L8GLW8_ACACF|nr:Rap1 Myb domain containing protein [Acanthamoeba castellanii str. Neff]ELR13718.1 Rap1 Myb domain containing protein [Acanthamoeba castellanii str. Neff]
MQAAPTLFTQNKKPMGFYLPPADRKGEMISRIEEHGGQVNAKWGKDLIVLVPPDYYGRAPPGAEPLESYRVQVPPSPAPSAKTKTTATAPATTTTPKTTATSASPSAAKAYTKEEDETIKSYVSSLSLAFSPTGTTIWMEMEKSKVVPGRTWQSLKDRYLKRILPVEEALGSLSAATSTSSSSTSSSTTSVAAKASPPSTPVRKQLFGKANTLDVSEEEEEDDDEEDEEGEEKEAEEDGDGVEDEDEGEDAGEEVSDGLKKSPKQQPSAKSRTVTSTLTTTNTTTAKRKASETPSSAVAKTASPAPKDKRRKIQDDSQEEEVENGKAPDSEAEEVEAGMVLKPSGQERTDRKPGGRVQEVEHVVARLQEETGQAESVVFHALAVASGDPALALLYLRGRQMWYEPWTPAEDKELQRSGAGGVAARAKADVRARRAFLGVH